MSSIVDALGWRGSGFLVSLFVVTDSPMPLALSVETEGPPPVVVRRYYLEDDAHVLAGLHTYQYDLVFEDLPPDLSSYLVDCLHQACTSGAKLAWLAFEGSFSFDHLLTEDVVDQIYGVCAVESEPMLALDDATRGSTAWKAELMRLRECLR